MVLRMGEDALDILALLIEPAGDVGGFAEEADGDGEQIAMPRVSKMLRADLREMCLSEARLGVMVGGSAPCTSVSVCGRCLGLPHHIPIQFPAKEQCDDLDS